MTKKRIYIIDDNDLMRESISALIGLEPDLEVCGQAASAQEALSKLGAAAPDLALVDLRLGNGIGGVRLLELLQESDADLATVALTGHAEAPYRQAALAAGARRFIDKKDAAEALVPAIREVLHHELPDE